MTKNNYKYYVGIDVSKSKLDIALSETGKIITCCNKEQDIKELINQFPTAEDSLVIMEATGGYERLPAQILRKQGYSVAIVNAKRVRDFAKANGTLAKTDTIDARTIWLFGKTFNPIAQSMESEEALIRQEYLNRRDQLIRLLTLEKQYLEHASNITQQEINEHIEYLNNSLALIEKKLEEMIHRDELLKEQVEQLDEIKGVGLITAMNVLIHLPELGKLSHKEISALAGLAPFNKDSGQTKGQRKIKGGRAKVRAALYMAVLSAKKFNPKIKRFYERLMAKGKINKIAIVACMRKLLIIMNAMLRDKAKWNPHY
jgi:transposase